MSLPAHTVMGMRAAAIALLLLAGCSGEFEDPTPVPVCFAGQCACDVYGTGAPDGKPDRFAMVIDECTDPTLTVAANRSCSAWTSGTCDCSCVAF